ncbi:MAG TPA: hypothetical protein DEP91_08540 [Sphingomonas bacterium]|jgi:hypothetical protein|uniref:Uncharacterized protein n=1 Tax=Sphingomonas bacterium TaxID=1895847 RepID=A0A3D0WDW3_9SPHN|nr:hypothetical protein [Sphingomonas bacterium]
MKMFFRAAALLLAISACPALAQTAQSSRVSDSPNGWAQLTAPCVTQPDNSCIAVSTVNPLPVTGGTGGGGGGTAGTEYTEDTVAPANPIAPALQLRRRDTPSAAEVSADGDWIAAISDSQGQLRIRAKELEALLGGTLTVGTHAVTQSGAWSVGQAGSWTVQLGSSGLGGSAGNPLFVSTPSSGTIAAPGSAAPANAQQVAGVGPAGNLRAIATDTRGALQSQQVQYLDSNAVALVANTAAQIDADVGGTAMTGAQRAARVYFTVQAITSPTAAVYLCFGGQGASCSATSYSYLIPSGATIGTLFTPPAGASTAVFAFSTAAVTLKVSSQVAQ